MANAARDNNDVTTIIGTSNADSLTSIRLQANPTTHVVLNEDNTNLQNQWKMNDDAANTTVTDTKGNNNGVASENTANLSTSDATMGDVFSFNGTDQFYTVAGVAPSTTAFSIAVWINITSNATGERVVDWHEATDDGFSIGFPSSASAMGFVIWNGATIVANINTGNLNLSQWYHIIVSYEVDDARIYLDGEQKAQDTSVTMVAPTGTSFTVGRRSDADSLYFNGLMHDLRHYDAYAIKDAEAATIYQESILTSDPAKRDDNNVTTIMAVSNEDGVTPVPVYLTADGELLLDSN